MVDFFDELTHEFFEKTATQGIFNLTGAKEGYATFASALRRDDNPIASGDRTIVSFRAGVKFLVCGVSVQVGAPSTLTVLTDYIFRTSDAGGGIPDFDAGGEVYISDTAGRVYRKDLDGNPLDPDDFRFPNFKPALADFAAETGSVDAEAVFVLGADVPAEGDAAAAIATMLGGVFAHDGAATETADNRDFADPPSGTGKRRRVPLKWCITKRVTITAGGTAVLFNAASLDRSTIYCEAASADGANRIAGEVIIGNQDPLTKDSLTIVADPVLGGIDFVEGDTGTEIRVLSSLGVDTEFDITVGRIR